MHYGAVCAKAPRDDLDQLCCRRLGRRLSEFVGTFITGRRYEAHPLLASKGLEAAQWGSPIPPRSASHEALVAQNLRPFRDARETCLVFSQQLHFVHQSTPAACACLAQLAEARGLRAIVSSDPNALGSDKSYGLVCLANMSGEAFDSSTTCLSDHLKNGKGILGLHAALASFLDGRDAVGGTELGHTSEIIADIFGCHFKNHPPPQTGTITFHSDAILSSDKKKTLTVYDEFFNFDRLPEDVDVLASLDESSYEGGTMGQNHPIVWTKSHGDGKAFYCGLGHFDSSYASDDSVVFQTLAAAVQYLAGPDPIDTAMTSPDYYGTPAS